MTSTKEINEKIEWMVKNWDIIPNKYKTLLKPRDYSVDIKDLSIDEHIVILLLDRQKPSIVPSYDFDQERIGITRFGRVVWGFDSGCSCPSPWDDHYPNCYDISKTWKEFEINLAQFDEGVLEECIKKIDEIQKLHEGQQ